MLLLKILAGIGLIQGLPFRARLLLDFSAASVCFSNLSTTSTQGSKSSAASAPVLLAFLFGDKAVEFPDYFRDHGVPIRN